MGQNESRNGDRNGGRDGSGSISTADLTNKNRVSYGGAIPLSDPNGNRRCPHDENDFALFRYLESTHNNKIMYVPVPVQCQLELHHQQSTVGTSQLASKLSTLPWSQSLSQQSQSESQPHNGYGHQSIKTSNQSLDQNRHQSEKVSSDGLLESGFRAFGQLVGHFILRKIVSADTGFGSEVSPDRV